MKILLTGHSGFLGSHIKDFLSSSNYELVNLGRSKSSDIIHDINDSNLSIGKVDCVIHSAGKAHIVPRTEEQKKEFYTVNYEGTKNLLENLKIKPKYFIFISTVSVYGLDYGVDIGENTPLKAKEAYGDSKIMAEKLISEWGERNNIVITILRLPLLVGKNPPGNLKSMILAIRKKYYFNIGKGDVRKSMVFASDVAEFIPTIMKNGGIFNLTDGHHPSFKELSNLIAVYYKIKKPISVAKFIVLCMAYFGEIFQTITGKKVPINKRQFTKMTKPLTFNDKKARTLGWNPKNIINHPNDWLSS